jgi:hypothetical protein
MTLSTKFVITAQGADPREVFEFNRQIIGCPDSKYAEGPGFIHNHIGQGFDAILDVDYSFDGSPVTGPGVRDCYCDEYDEADRPCGPCAEPVGWVKVDWDTAYGHRVGEVGCTELHARYITAMAAWCDARRLSYAWQNEYTGKWFTDLTGLEDFGNSGAQAMDWFNNMAMPAIAAHVSASTS